MTPYSIFLQLSAHWLAFLNGAAGQSLFLKLNFSFLQNLGCITEQGKIGKILKGSLDSIPSPSSSVKTQIMGGKVCLRCKGKTLLGIVNKLFVFKSLLTMPSNVLPLHLKQTFPPIFEFSLKMKVMGSIPGYFFKSFLLLANFYSIPAIISKPGKRNF